MSEVAGNRPVQQGTVGESTDDDAVPLLLPPSSGLSSAQASLLLEEYGLNAPPRKTSRRWQLLLRCSLHGPTTASVWVLLLAVMALTQQWLSCVCLAVAVASSGLVAFLAARRVQSAAERVMEAQQRRSTSIALRDGRWRRVLSSRLVPGDLIKLTAGTVVPADCTVDAVIEVDEAALTGESLPASMGPESMPKMGSIVVQGEAHGTVQFTGPRSFSGRLLRLLQAQQGREPTAAKVSKNGGLHGALTQILFAVATTVAAMSVLLAGFALGYRKSPLIAALEEVVLAAVAALPIGLEAAVTVAVAVGAWHLTQRERVLPVRLSSLCGMAAMDVLYVDKTGTLTANALELQDECYLFSPAYTRDRVVLLAALSLRWREPAVDPLDSVLLAAADLAACDAYTQLEHTPYSDSTCRTEATVRGPDGVVFKVTKGMVHAVLQLVEDRRQWRPEVERAMDDLGRRGLRCIIVAHTITTTTAAAAAAEEEEEEPTPEEEPKTANEGAVEGKGGPALRWRLAGMLTFLDPLRHDAADTLRRLESLGIAVRVITGDHPLITREIVRRLGLGNASVATTGNLFPRHTAGVGSEGRGISPPPPSPDSTLREDYGAVLRSFSAYADARPQEKYIAVEAARQCGHTIGFLGDGINDAPALQHADVGIALMTQDGTAGLRRAAAVAVAAPRGAEGEGEDEDNGNNGDNEEGERTALLAAAVSTPPAEACPADTAAAAAASWAHTVADAVALTPSLSKIVEAVLRARATVCVIESALAFRICCSLHMAVFLLLSPLLAPGDEASDKAGGGGGGGGGGAPRLRLTPLLICVNAACLTVLTVLVAFDRPPPAQSLTHPHQWNAAAMMLVAVPVALVGAGCSLLLQWVLTDSLRDVDDGSWRRALGVPAIPNEYAATALYLALSLSNTLALLSCRARPMVFCGLSRPGRTVSAAVVTVLAASTALSAFLPSRDDEESSVSPVAAAQGEGFARAKGLMYSPDSAVRLLLLWVWLWSLGSWWLQELTRIVTGAVLWRLNVLHFCETAEGCRPPQPIGREQRGGPWREQSNGVSLGVLEVVERRLLE